MRRFFVQLSCLDLDQHVYPDWKALANAQHWQDKARFIDRFQALLGRIPPIERDILELYFVKKKRECQISRMLNLSQQAVSHRLHVAYRRLSFMLVQPDIPIATMRRDLRGLFEDPETVEVLCSWAVTSSQIATARQLKIAKARVSFHVTEGLKALRAMTGEPAIFYQQFFDRLLHNRNIFREVLAGPRRPTDARIIEARKYTRFAGAPTTAGNEAAQGPHQGLVAAAP